MNDSILYSERLPKYVFNGTWYSRSSVKTIQLWYRLGSFMIFVGTMYLILIYQAFEKTSNPVMFGIAMIAAWLGCAILLYISEYRHQFQLDGNIPTVICVNRISIPPRLIRRMKGEPDYIDSEQIDHIEVMRGNGGQYIAKKEGVCWMGSPIGIKIVTKSRKKYGLGYKPPSTVKEIVDVLATHWNIRIEDPGSGMGRGLRYVGDKVLWELPYEDIMRMNIFEWQD